MKDEPVSEVCLALPVLMGRGGQARRLMRELDGPRGDDHARSQRRRGIERELWYLAVTPLGELLIAFIASRDYALASSRLASSRDEFDVWLKAGLRSATGIDLAAAEPCLRLPHIHREEIVPCDT